MLYWICPECGRECSPTVRDCPGCALAPEGSAANGGQAVLAQENGASIQSLPGLAVAVDDSIPSPERAGSVPADEALASLVRPLVESATPPSQELAPESFSIALELRAEAVLEAINARIASDEAARAQLKAEEEARAQREAEEAARILREAEEAARIQQEADEQARAQREAEEAARIQQEAEEHARAQREAEEAARLEQEAEEQALAQREAEEIARQAEEQARAQREAEEAARLAEEQARAQREAEEAARIQQETEEAARIQREAEDAARLAEEQARAQREAEEAARIQQEAEEAARIQREAEEAARLAEEAARAQREAEETARIQHEAEEQARAQREAEEAARAQQEAEEAALLALFQAEDAGIRGVVASFERPPTFPMLSPAGEVVVAPAPPSTEWMRMPRPEISACPPKEPNFASVAWAPQAAPVAGPCLPNDLEHLSDLRTSTRTPERKSFSLPAWTLSVILATAVFLGTVNLIQRVRSAGDHNATPPAAAGTAQAIPASTAASAREDAGTKFLEVAGLRVVTTWNHKQQLHYIVVNHSGSDVPGMPVRIAVRRFEAASSALPLFTVDAALPSLGPYQSKEVRTDLDSDSTASAVQDWQSLRAEVVATDAR